MRHYGVEEQARLDATVRDQRGVDSEVRRLHYRRKARDLARAESALRGSIFILEHEDTPGNRRGVNRAVERLNSEVGFSPGVFGRRLLPVPFVGQNRAGHFNGIGQLRILSRAHDNNTGHGLYQNPFFTDADFLRRRDMPESIVVE